MTQTALATAAWMTLPTLGSLAFMRPSPTGAKKIGLQLYSLKDQLTADPRAWIAKVAEAGYTDVETFGLDKNRQYFGMDLAAFAALLKEHHLETSSGHYAVDEYLSRGRENELGPCIDSVHTLGQEYFTIPFLNPDIRKTADDWIKIAGKFNALAAHLGKENVRLAYHNHDFEFSPVADKTTGLDLLLQNTDPALVHFEMDIYWVVRAGVDPNALFHTYPGRFPLWHIKDMDKVHPELNTEVGSGSIDFQKIFSEAHLAGLKQTFMEQENFAPGMDPYTSVAQSAAYIKNKLLD